ncbi:MAG: exodeoxyribonuclease III [Desulfomonilaceae bacterium]|nr:exodeoxyribonuclease III [Desulfomonilaceae bacterium]
MTARKGILVRHECRHGDLPLLIVILGEIREKVRTMSRTIRILSWNVNGIRAAAKKGFLELPASESPDILCIQETKARPEQVTKALLSPPGYASFWNAAQKKGYSGVAVYTKETPIHVETSLGVRKFDEEGRFIRLDFKEFSVINVYFPNGKMNAERLRFKMEFYETFLDYVQDLRATIPRLCFLGDVNTAHREMDLARPKENSNVSGFLPEEREWIDKVVAAGYVDTFRDLNKDLVQYSWWDLKSRARERNVGWRIDYVFVTAEMRDAVKNAFILTDVMGSDHCPVGVELEFS